jgi:hypothetical protein
MHIDDLDGVSSKAGKNWKASITIIVYNTDQKPVTDATVSGSWSGGYAGTVTCITDRNGQCTVTTSAIVGKQNSVAFTVDGVTHAMITYQPAANTDPDGDSDGTTITVNKPS